MIKKLVNNTELILIENDITKLEIDAIVNAANNSLMGGGGVDGAIHRAGGPKILEECKKIIQKIGSLETGKAVITTGGNLPAKYVIHTVGPIWHDGVKNEKKLLEDAYYNSLLLGMQNGLKSIAFPSISTGVYNYPIEQASKIAYETTVNFLEKNKLAYEKILFVVFSRNNYEVYEKLF